MDDVSGTVLRAFSCCLVYSSQLPFEAGTIIEEETEASGHPRCCLESPRKWESLDVNAPRWSFSVHILCHHVGMPRARWSSHTWAEGRQAARDKAKNQRQLMLETFMDYLSVFKEKAKETQDTDSKVAENSNQARQNRSVLCQLSST